MSGDIQTQSTLLDLRQFVQQNQAKDFRDKIQTMYEEFLCVKINKNMTVAEKDQASRRFLRKAATHALNALQDTREEFIHKYLEKYHAKIKAH